MLVAAQLYREEIEREFWRTVYDDKYKYYTSRYINSNQLIQSNNWDRYQFASINTDGELIGYIGYSIDNITKNIDTFSAINFTGGLAFGLDVLTAIDNIFCKYNYRKLNFTVTCGNPIEKTYDKLINMYGGRIVGIKEEEEMIDNKYHDVKLYEITKDNYINNRPTHFKRKDQE